MKDESLEVDAGALVVRAPLQGTIVSVAAAEGDRVQQGAALVIMEAMKMEHVIAAKHGGVVRRVSVAAGDTVPEGHLLLVLEARAGEGGGVLEKVAVPIDHVRPDLQEVLER